MSSTGPIVGSLQIARAYGVRAPARAMREPMGSERQQDVKPEPAGGTQRLVAAWVPGRVNFAGAAPAQDASALAMYRHPADKNAAATGVSAGRMIDVEG